MTAPSTDAGFSQRATDIVDTVKAYAKQEVVDPLKGVGRYLVFGLGGTVLLGIGGVLCGVALLRVLQNETGTTFTGNWSWVPYLIVLVAYGIVIAIVASRIGKTDRMVARGKR